MSSSFWVFIIHVFGVHQCGVKRFFASMSPMWGLKVFSLEVINVEFERVLGRSVAKGKTVLP